MEWISVKDRLPNKIGEYLGVSRTNDGFNIFGKVEVVELYESIHPKEEETVLKFQDYVTHWMPLPKPPQVKHKTNEK